MGSSSMSMTSLVCVNVSQGFIVALGYFDPPLTQILPAAENREEGLKGPVDKQNAKGESQRKHSSHVRMK